ncbi:hypothetical protein FGO68_gene608 [Halteria grandinella]|uniref:Uncharacterized protein n=1 Tax=Halteria grandinella TaxID=5974 RepID=A0A8J8NAN9_HALGN|nr:hypothetical protein FGO68_gene608 [Halteria grandinella]
MRLQKIGNYNEPIILINGFIQIDGNLDGSVAITFNGYGSPFNTRSFIQQSEWMQLAFIRRGSSATVTEMYVNGIFLMDVPQVCNLHSDQRYQGVDRSSPIDYAQLKLIQGIGWEAISNFVVLPADQIQLPNPLLFPQIHSRTGLNLRYQCIRPSQQCRHLVLHRPQCSSRWYRVQLLQVYPHENE